MGEGGEERRGITSKVQHSTSLIFNDASYTQHLVFNTVVTSEMVQISLCLLDVFVLLCILLDNRHQPFRVGVKILFYY